MLHRTSNHCRHLFSSIGLLLQLLQPQPILIVWVPVTL
jgi:hypothetical protein